MSRYTPLEGIVTNIAAPFGASAPCSLLLTLRTEYGETFLVAVSPSTYVYNQEPVRMGDTIIAYYDTLAPMPLIFPPQYQAVIVVKPFPSRYAMLDTFDQNQQNSEGSLVLNLSGTTDIRTQNGQIYPGSLTDQLLLVLYSTTTRSNPAQTTPETIVVFCTP